MKNDTITITVKFFANLRDYGPKREEIVISKETTFKDLLRRYNVPKEEKNLIVFVNNRPNRNENFTFNNNDVVAIFPMIAGG